MKLNWGKNVIKTLIITLCVALFSLLTASTIATFEYKSQQSGRSVARAASSTFDLKNGLNSAGTDGNYTSYQYFTITDSTGLINFYKSLRYYSYDKKTITLENSLTNTITINDGWQTETKIPAKFMGTFDGKNNAVRIEFGQEALFRYITNDSYGASIGSCLGFIPYNSGTISNLKMSYCVANVSLFYPSENFGAITGVNFGTINNCRVDYVRPHTIKQNIYFGGIAGRNYSTINNCEIVKILNTESTSVSMGCLVGLSKSGTISQCFSQTAINLAGVNAGGTISTCYTSLASSSTIKTNFNIKDNNTNTYWFMYSGYNSGYPTLKAFIDLKLYNFNYVRNNNRYIESKYIPNDIEIAVNDQNDTELIISWNPAETIQTGEMKGYKFLWWEYSDSRNLWTANYEVIEYLIDYNMQDKELGDDGKKLSAVKGFPENYEIIFTVNQGAFSIPNPEREGFNFTGWSGTNLNGENNKNLSLDTGSTGDRKYTAHWEDVVYNITYELNGGNLSGQTNPATYKYRDSFSLNNPVRTGYNFLGWTCDNSKFSGTEVSIPQRTSGDLKFTANWQIITYNISYNLAGGALNAGETNPTEYKVSQLPIQLKNPTKLGYVFLGWTGSNGTTPATACTIANGTTGDLWFTANWAPNTYILSFDIGEGSATTVTPTINLNGVVQSGKSIKLTIGTEITAEQDKVNNKYFIKAGDYEIEYDLSSSENRKYAIEMSNFGLLATIVNAQKLYPTSADGTLLANNSEIRISPRITLKTYSIGGE